MREKRAWGGCCKIRYMRCDVCIGGAAPEVGKQGGLFGFITFRNHHVWHVYVHVAWHHALPRSSFTSPSPQLSTSNTLWNHPRYMNAFVCESYHRGFQSFTYIAPFTDRASELSSVNQWQPQPALLYVSMASVSWKIDYYRTPAWFQLSLAWSGLAYLWFRSQLSWRIIEFVGQLSSEPSIF